MSVRTCIKAKVKANKITKEKAKELLTRYDNRVAQLEASGFARDLAKNQATKDLMDVLNQQAVRSRRVANLKIQAAARITKAMEGDALKGAEAHFFPDVNADRANVPNLDIEHDVVRNMLHALFVEGIRALRPRASGLIRKKAVLQNVLREMFGQDTGDATAKAIAKAWADSAEFARRMFNDVGGAIAKRADWRLPQMHDMEKVGNVSVDRWIEETLPLLDRAKMTDEFGEPLTDQALDKALRKTYDRIRTDGLIDLTPGAGGGKSFANRLQDHRFLIFKDADSWLQYQERFGADDIYGTMVHHLDSMAKEIAAMRVLGPNPQHMVRYIDGYIRQQAAIKGEKVPGLRLKRLNNAWEYYTGKTSNPVNPGLANFMSGTRQTLTSIQLGSAVLSALPTDPFFQAMTRHLNGLPMMGMLKDYVRLMFKEKDIALAVQVGLGAENWTTQGLAQMRYFGEMAGPKVTSVFADAAMKLSLMSQFTQAGQHTFGMGVLGFMARNAGKTFDKIEPAFRQSLERYGIDAADWDVIRASEFIDQDGAKFVNPTALAKAGHLDVATKIQRQIIAEGRFARPIVGLKTRATLTQGTQAGSITGELLMRNIAMYKSFPVEILHTHMARYMAMNGTKRGKYLATFLIGSMFMGALAVQMKDLARGKDPRNMDPTSEEGLKFWAAAAAQGGGLGIFGDFFFSDANRFGKGPVTTFMGPVAGAADDFAKLTLGNMQELLGGEDTHVGRELVQTAGRYTPIASSLFYTKLAFQRLVIDQLALMADPDAHDRFRRMERQARKDYGNEYWWRPGQTAPSRTPNFTGE
jgi:hypothetical protein